MCLTSNETWISPCAEDVIDSAILHAYLIFKPQVNRSTWRGPNLRRLISIRHIIRTPKQGEVSVAHRNIQEFSVLNNMANDN